MNDFTTLYFKIFRNKYLSRYVFNSIEQSSREREQLMNEEKDQEKRRVAKGYKFKDIPCEELSQLLYGETVLYEKLKHDKSFYYRHQVFPELLKKCTNVLILKEMYTRYPHLFKEGLLFQHPTVEYNDTWVVDSIAESGSVPCLVFALSLGLESGKNAMNNAARHGHLEVVRFLDENQKAGCDVSAIDLAAKCEREDGGGLLVVQYLLEHRTEGFSSAALMNVGGTKNIELARLLFDTVGNSRMTKSDMMMKYVKVDHAIPSGSLEMVELYYQRLSTSGLTDYTLNKAAEKGCLDILQFIHSIGARATVDAVIYAAAKGHYQVVRFLYENRTEKSNSNAISKAAAKGHSDIVKYLLVNGCEGTPSAVKYAASGGYLDTVKILCDRFVECPQSTLVDVIKHCPSNNLIEMVTYLLNKCRVTQEALSEAAKHGNIQLYDLLLEHLPEASTPVLNQARLDLCAQFGHGKLVLHMEKQGDGRLLENVFYNSFRMNMVDVLKFIWNTNPGYFNISNNDPILQVAIANKHIKVLEFILSIGYIHSFQGVYYFNQACLTSNLDIIKFLHFETKSQCTTLAMDNAAKVGSFDIVKFLHENRTEGCSKSACTLAIGHGHYEIAQFLLENRSEASYHEAMDAAAKHGSLQFLEYIRARYSDVEPTHASFQIANHRIFKYLTTHYQNATIGSSIHLSYKSVELLQRVYREVYNTDLPQPARPAIIIRSISYKDTDGEQQQQSSPTIINKFKNLFK